MGRGSPMISIRLPQQTITALRKISKDDQTSVSDLIRQQIDQLIAEKGVRIPTEQLPGQTRIDV